MKIDLGAKSRLLKALIDVVSKHYFLINPQSSNK